MQNLIYIWKTNINRLRFKFTFLALCFILCVSTTKAINIDSLKKVIPTLPDDTLKLRLLNAVFITISNKGDFDEALNYGQQALTLADALKEDAQMAKTIHQFGLTYRNMGKFDLALEKLFEALKIRERLGFKKAIAASYSTIGTVYGAQKKYGQAKEYLDKSIQIFQEEKDSINVILPLSNLGALFAEEHKHQDAIAIFKKVLVSYEFRKDTNNIIANNYNIGTAYKELGSYDTAMEYLSKAQVLADKIQLKIVQANVAAEISELHLRRNENAKAKAQIEKGLTIAEQTGDLPSLTEIYKHKAKFDSTTGDYKGALNAYVKYSKLKDSMTGETSVKNVERIGMQYEYDKKIDAQEKKQEGIVRNRNIWFILIGICSIFSLLLFWSYRKRQSAQKQLEIAQTKNRISRDLHDELGSTLSSVSLQASVAKKRIDRNEDVTDIIHNIGESSKDMVSKMSDIVWSLQSVNENLSQLVERIDNYCASTLPDNEVEYSIENNLLVSNIPIQPDVLKELYLIIKEALNNSLKHASCRSILIRFSEIENRLLVHILDDGKGFDTNRPARSLGGDGLKNMKQRAEKISADFVIESKLEEGTQINISIPLL